ncbi:MAG: tetratricopeptide repeat protein [Cyanobacteria bacterium P01_F01_bin.86]
MNFLQKPQPNPSDTPLGGRYQVIQRLGEGGFGQTFLARDKHLPGHPICVIKQLNPQVTDAASLQTARRLFDTEAKVLYQLGDHDQIPRLMAHFEDGQEFYLAQEYIDSEPLSKVLATGEPWPQERVISMLQDILQILTFVHEQDVIHRDIKPANLLCRYRDGRIVLIDFGAVKQVNTQFFNPQGHTNLTISIGTQGYMPNEQLAGTPHFSSDIYAVGVIGIQALTGIQPKHLGQDPHTSELDWRSAAASVDSAFADVLDRMVRYDFRSRYPTATEALKALQDLPSALQARLPQHWYTPQAERSPLASLLSSEVEGNAATVTWGLDNQASTQPEPSQGSEQGTLAAMGHHHTRQFASGQKPKGSTLAIASVLQVLPQRKWWLLGSLVGLGALLLVAQTSVFSPSANQAASSSAVSEEESDAGETVSTNPAAQDAPDSDSAEADSTATGDSETEASGKAAEGAEDVESASEVTASESKPSPGEESAEPDVASSPAKTSSPVAASSPATVPPTAQPVSQVSTEAAPPQASSASQLNEANTLREGGQYLEALELYDAAIAGQPNSVTAHWGRCYSLNQLQQLEAAIEACDQAIALDGNDPRPLASKGFALQQQQRHAEALALFDQAIDRQPDNVEAWNNRGISLLQLERIDEALHAFDQAIELQPDLAEAWNNRGAALWSLRRFDEAIASTEQAIALNPNYSEAQSLRQKMREKLGW